MKTKYYIFFALLFTFSLTTLGCDSEDGGTHDLTVQWNISGLSTCSAFLPPATYAQGEIHFDTVEVNIYEDETAQMAVQSPAPVPCGTFETKINRLPRGKYFVTVDAFGTYDGNTLAFFRGEAVVSVPVENDIINLPLQVGDGQIHVAWKFGGGMICGLEKEGEVKNVVIRLNEEEYKVSCGEGHLTLDNVYPNNDYRIEATALNSNGEILYHARLVDNPFEVLPGQSFPANLVFQ